MKPEADIDTDMRLVGLIKKADKDAMYSLYRLYCGYLAAICSRYVPDPEDSKDILQDTFLQIFNSIQGFDYRGVGSLKAWMGKIAVNQSLRFIKEHQKIEFTELSDKNIDIQYEEPEISGITPAEIHRLISELPDGYRTIFNLYVIEEKSHKEIAGLLGIKESTSASQLHRAKAILASKIRKLTEGIV